MSWENVWYGTGGITCYRLATTVIMTIITTFNARLAVCVCDQRICQAAEPLSWTEEDCYGRRLIALMHTNGVRIQPMGNMGNTIMKTRRNYYLI